MNSSENYTKKNNIKKYREDEIIYRIGIILLIPFICAGFWFAAKGYIQYGELFACSFKRMCGLPCPGCGGTRALYYLFRGKLLKSIQMNPAVLYGILAYVHFMWLFFYRKHIAKTIANKTIQIQNYMYGAIVVILMQWIIKIIVIFLSL